MVTTLSLIVYLSGELFELDCRDNDYFYYYSLPTDRKLFIESGQGDCRRGAV